MGCQGEIYNVYGIVTPAKIFKKNKPGREGWDQPVIYEINGKKVSHDETNEKIDFHAGIPTAGVNLDKPELICKVLGHDTYDMGSRHFKEEALIGYVVANESYINSATELPELSDIKSLQTSLIKEINEIFGIKVDKKAVKLFIVFDSLNG